MKYEDENGNIKTISVKVGDTTPIGGIIEIPDDMEVPSGWEEVRYAGEIYSTEERIIGYWENNDGTYQPLYRKIFKYPGTFTIPSNGLTNWDITSLGSIIKELVEIKPRLKYNDNTASFLHFKEVSRINNSNEVFVVFTDTLSSVTLKDMELTLEYTKTTDTPISEVSD